MTYDDRNNRVISYLVFGARERWCRYEQTILESYSFVDYNEIEFIQIRKEGD